MRQLKNGKTLCLVLGLALSACRSSTPPKIEVCILDGYGGADCVERDGSKLYRKPSELTNFWATNQVDQAAFASWCYKATPDQVSAAMAYIEKQAK